MSNDEPAQLRIKLKNAVDLIEDALREVEIGHVIHGSWISDARKFLEGVKSTRRGWPSVPCPRAGCSMPRNLLNAFEGAGCMADDCPDAQHLLKEKSDGE